MSAIILFYTEGTITVSFLALIGTGLSVLMVFFVALGLILNTFKGIKQDFESKLIKHQTDVRKNMNEVSDKVKGKVPWTHFEETIDRVDKNAQVNKEIEHDHFITVDKKLNIIIAKI